MLPKLEAILKTPSLRAMLTSYELARLGDFLTNYIYSAVRMGYFGISGSIHVWDNVLRDAMELADLRRHLGKKTKPERVADAGEALIAYAYHTSIFSLEEMIRIIENNMSKDDFATDKKEMEACGRAFSKLFSVIFLVIEREQRFSKE